MNAILQKLVDSASDLGVLAKSMGEAGLETVQSAWQGVSLMGSLSVLSPNSLERDETHYLLVPQPDLEYTLFTRRILPAGVGATNSLPKARIFHVPDRSGREILEEKLLSHALKSTEAIAESDLADRLEALADDIDRETRSVSGGLLLIGGAVAFVNPVIGAGIAAQALTPSLSTTAAKAGVGFIGEKMRSLNKSQAEAKATKEAEKEIKRLKPEIYPNPILQGLDALFSHADGDFDPFLDQGDLVGQFEEYRYFQVTIDSIRSVFESDLARGRKSSLDGAAKQWVQHLSELAAV